MSFSLVNSAATSNNGAGGTLGVAPVGTTVAAGDLVVVSASCTGILGITSVSDGTTTFTTETELHTSNSGNSLRSFYLLASVATGLPTYTVTYSGTPTSRSLTVYIFRPTAAASKDGFAGQEVIATTAGSSGNTTTAGTDDLVFGTQANENASGSSLEKINANARTAVIDSGTGHTLWYFPTSTPFTGNASETIATSTRILTVVSAFKIAAGGASFVPFQPQYQAAPVMAQ